MNTSIDLYGRQINIDTQNIDPKQIQTQTQKEKEEYLAQQEKLPDAKTIFRIEGQLFMVTYVNYGKKRISATWFDDRSQPFSVLPELDSSCSINGKLYKVTFHNESKKRITIEPIN